MRNLCRQNGVRSPDFRADPPAVSTLKVDSTLSDSKGQHRPAAAEANSSHTYRAHALILPEPGLFDTPPKCWQLPFCRQSASRPQIRSFRTTCPRELSCLGAARVAPLSSQLRVLRIMGAETSIGAGPGFARLNTTSSPITAHPVPPQDRDRQANRSAMRRTSLSHRHR